MEQAQSPAPLPPAPRGRPIDCLALLLAAGVLVYFGWHERRLIHPAVLLGAFQQLGHLMTTWQMPWATLSGLAVGILSLLGLLGAGAVCRRWAGLTHRRWTPGERLALWPLAGAIPYSLLILLLGLLHLTPWLWLPVVVFGAIGVRELAALIRESRSRRPWRRTRRTPADRLLWGIVLLTGSLSLIYALAPAAESDELRYHLAAPATWLREGGIQYLPWQAFSNFPFLGEMLYMAIMPWSPGSGAAKVIHWGMMPVCMMLIGLMARRLMAASGGTLATRHRGALAVAAAFGTLPMVPILAGWAFIDLFVTAYFLAFAYTAMRVLRRPKRAGWIAVGWMAAGALSTKYSMVPLLGALMGLWGVLLWRRAGWRYALRSAAGAGSVAGLLAAPWYLKNYFWTGNPVYPLGWSIFRGGEWSAANAAFYLAKAAGKGIPLEPEASAGGRLLDWLATPWNITVHYHYYEDHLLGPLPLMALLLVLAWGARRIAGGGGGASIARRLPLVWCVLLALATWGFWYLTYQSNRFLMPTLALLLALAAAGWAALPLRTRRTAGGLALAALSYASFASVDVLLLPTTAPGNRVEAVATALGGRPQAIFLERKLNYWRAADWLNRHAQPGERALLVGEHRTLYFKLPVLASDWFDTPQPLPWIRATTSNDALLNTLSALGVRYILLNEGELRLYREQFFRPRFTADEYRRFEALWAHPRLQLVEQFTRPGFEDCRIYTILPPPLDRKEPER